MHATSIGYHHRAYYNAIEKKRGIDNIGEDVVKD